MRMTKGIYYPRGSDLKINVVAVPWQDDYRAQMKLILINKHNGIVYGRPKYYKVYKRDILHWSHSNYNWVDIP